MGMPRSRRGRRSWPPPSSSMGAHRGVEGIVSRGNACCRAYSEVRCNNRTVYTSPPVPHLQIGGGPRCGTCWARFVVHHVTYAARATRECARQACLIPFVSKGPCITRGQNGVRQLLVTFCPKTTKGDIGEHSAHTGYADGKHCNLARERTSKCPSCLGGAWSSGPRYLGVVYWSSCLGVVGE